MLNYVLTILILILNFIFQTTILQHFKVFGVIPNTTLILVIICGLLKGKYRGAAIGLVAGLIQDVFFGGAIGLNALIFAVIGYIAGLLDDKVFKENLVLPFVTVLCGTIIYHTMYYFSMVFLFKDVDIIVVIKGILWIEMIYNGILMTFVYKKVLKHYKEPSIKFTKRIR